MKPIALEKESDSLVLNGLSISLGAQLSAAAYCREAETYLAILAAKSPSDTEEVVGLSPAGEMLFRLNLPEGWQFYYFSSHIDYPLAMVCTSPNEHFDWYWGIEPKYGRLISLNRAH